MFDPASVQNALTPALEMMIVPKRDDLAGGWVALYPPIFSGAVVPSREGTTHDPSSPPSLGWPDKLPLSRSSHAAAGGCHDGAAAPRCPNPDTGIDRPSGISSKNGSSPRSPSVLLGQSQHELAPGIDRSSADRISDAYRQSQKQWLILSDHR